MPRRPFFRIGPAFLISLVLAGGYLWWNKTRESRPAGPIIVQHQTAPDAAGLIGIPDPPFVAAQAAALGLSAAQAQRVHEVEASWGKETADLQRRLDAAAASLDARLRQSGAGKLTPADYQAEAVQVQILSGELSQLRQAYWPRLQAILTREQQQQARDAWSDAHRLRGPGVAGSK